MKIYTRSGDRGETALFDGERVPKSAPRVDVYGEVDELNASIGAVLAEPLNEEVATMLQHVQRDLFAVGGRLADPSRKVAERVRKAAIEEADVDRLEQWIDAVEAELPPIRHFVLPGGSRPAALLHVARTVCRRAERRLAGLRPGPDEALLLVYMNRLSDLLFVLARAVNYRAGVTETEW